MSKALSPLPEHPSSSRSSGSPGLSRSHSKKSVRSTSSGGGVSAFPDDEEILVKQVNACSLEYLISECVPLSMRVQERLALNDTDVSALMKNLKINEESTKDEKDTESPEDLPQQMAFGRVDFMDDPKFKDINCLYRVETYGFEIGYKVTDCIAFERSASEGVTVKLVDTLEMMKFICRDVWKVFFGKQMDNLRTNHVGTFVLIDKSFKPLRNFYSGSNEAETVKKTEPYLQFPCGLIRGILSSLGVECVVNAEVKKLPGVTFNVETNLSQ